MVLNTRIITQRSGSRCNESDDMLKERKSINESVISFFDIVAVFSFDDRPAFDSIFFGARDSRVIAIWSYTQFLYWQDETIGYHHGTSIVSIWQKALCCRYYI